MEQIPIYFYFIFFQMTFLIHEMNIQLFSFDWGELYWGFHNSEPPLTLLNLDFAEPWFKILLTQCSVLVTDFSYNFYINIHEWAWRSSLHSDLSATVTFGVLFYHVLGDSLCVDFSVPWMFEIIYLRNHLGLVIREWCIFNFFSD